MARRLLAALAMAVIALGTTAVVLNLLGQIDTAVENFGPHPCGDPTCTENHGSTR